MADPQKKAERPDRPDVDKRQKYRLPLYLYYYEGYTAAEVGELLGLGPSTVRTRLARAREKLKAQLREE